jgi:LPS export ABC transporter protein LptC
VERSVNRRRKALAAVIIAAALAGFGGWFFIRQSEMFEQARDLAEDVNVDVSMQGLTLTRGEEGDVRWKLDAKGAKYLQEEGRIRVDAPRITYYPKDSDQDIEVRAPEGEVDQNTEEAWLWSRVVMHRGESTVTAGRLHYAGENRTITLTGGVVLERPDMRVVSDAAVMDLAADTLTAEGGVKAVIHKDFEQDGQKEQ